MRFTALFYLCFLLCFSHTAKTHADALPRGTSIDLTSQSGVELVQGAWRYSDVQLVPTQHRAPDANGQPTGAPVDTWDYRAARRRPRLRRLGLVDARAGNACPHVAVTAASRSTGTASRSPFRRAVGGVDVGGLERRARDLAR